MPKSRPTRPGQGQNSGSEQSAQLRADVEAAWNLEAIRSWIGERRSNPKGHTAPPPNMRILEARVTDAVRRHASRVEDHRAPRRNRVPGRLAEDDVIAATYFSPLEALEWISKHLSTAQRKFLSAPDSDERLCDDFLDAVVAQSVGNAQGLALPELRARASALGWALVSPAQYASFYREEVLPAWSQLGGEVRRCPECGGAFALSDKRQRYCSDTCSARQRNRGRQKVGNGRSAAETARKRAEVKVRSHFQSCNECKAGRFCPTREALLQSDDALSRRSDDVTPELAEEMQASQGRKRKRGTG